MVEWFKTSGLMIVAVVAAVWLANKFSLVLVRRAVARTLRRDKFASEMEERRREDTLVNMIHATLKVTTWLIAGLIVVNEFGLNIGPLLAGAGVIGIAIAFGAQELIKDFITGMFIVMENQYRIGDVVEINNISGKVIAIGMRATVLRDLDGKVHHIPNGSIKLSTNMTMDFSKINLDIGVGYGSDIDKVEEVVNKVGDELAEDEVFGIDVIKAPRFSRVKEFAESAIIIKIIGKTKPGKHWALAGELRRRLLKAFAKADIEIPYPQRVVHEGKKKS